MKNFKLILAIVMVFYFVFALNSFILAQDGTDNAGKPRLKMQCKDNFAKLDADKDAKVSLEEFKAIEHPKAKGIPEDIFKSRDANNDGFLTEEEFCAKKQK